VDHIFFATKTLRLWDWGPGSPGYAPECRYHALCSEVILHGVVKCPYVSSGGASAVKEPGHFEIRKSSSQVTRMHFFPQKSWRPFLVVALKTQATNAVSPSK